MTEIQFQHKQSAHCENGVTSNLFSFHGLHISEPLVFGIGSGLFFAHMPFMKLHGLPVTGFRPFPGIIFKRAARKLGIKMKVKTFRDQEKAMAALDANLAAGIPTGCVVGVFHLTYFPEPYRFHFNAHNLVAFKKVNDLYYISDPVMEQITTLNYKDFKRVRFAKGTAEPKGKMYWPVSVPKEVNLKKAIIKGIRKTCYDMTEIPLPFFGAKGINYLANRMLKWPKIMPKKKALLNLGQVVRMQEEIGTGGAGFRFMYAAFLFECAQIFEDERFKNLGLEMTKIGDDWRAFAYEAGRLVKNRSDFDDEWIAVAKRLKAIAANEQDLFERLYKLAKEWSKSLK